MRSSHDARGGIVSFALAGEVTAALDSAAAGSMMTRSALVRRLVVQHLREAALLSRTTSITPAGERRRVIREKAA